MMRILCFVEASVVICWAGSALAAAEAATTSSLKGEYVFTTGTLPAPQLITTGTRTGLLPSLEKRLGRQLSPQERSQLMILARDQGRELGQIQAQFAQEISRITDVPESDVTFMLPVIGAPVENLDKILFPKLEARLKHKLTSAQIDSIRNADKQKKQAMVPVRKKYVDVLAQQTGVSDTEISDMLPKIGN